MIVRDKDNRLILWGYCESEDRENPTALGQLAYIADGVYNPVFLLNNGKRVRIPSQYLGSTFPFALNNLVIPILPDN